MKKIISIIAVIIVAGAVLWLIVQRAGILPQEPPPQPATDGEPAIPNFDTNDNLDQALQDLDAVEQ